MTEITFRFLLSLSPPPPRVLITLKALQISFCRFCFGKKFYVAYVSGSSRGGKRNFMFLEKRKYDIIFHDIAFYADAPFYTLPMFHFGIRSSLDEEKKSFISFFNARLRSTVMAQGISTRHQSDIKSTWNLCRRKGKRTRILAPKWYSVCLFHLKENF